MEEEDEENNERLKNDEEEHRSNKSKVSFKKHRVSKIEKIQEIRNRNDSEESEPKRKCGVTETPDMDVVIGYNMFPDGLKNRNIPMIMLNEEPLPLAEDFIGLPGFEGVRETKKVLFRRVPGNNFFYELVKTNASHERVFLICEPKFGTRLLNLSGRNFNIMFVGRQGKEVLAIRPCPNTKETVSVFYRQREIGRIIKHNTDNSENSHSILDSELRKIFVLQKSYQLIPRSTCCVTHGNQKIGDGYKIFSVSIDDSMNDNTTQILNCVGSIKDTFIKFNANEQQRQQLNVLEKTLLFAAHVSLKTKAMESAGIGLRISMSFSSISIS